MWDLARQYDVGVRCYVMSVGSILVGCTLRKTYTCIWEKSFNLLVIDMKNWRSSIILWHRRLNLFMLHQLRNKFSELILSRCSLPGWTHAHFVVCERHEVHYLNSLIVTLYIIFCLNDMLKKLFNSPKACFNSFSKIV